MRPLRLIWSSLTVISALIPLRVNRVKWICNARPMPTDNDCSMAARLAGGKATLAGMRAAALLGFTALDFFAVLTITVPVLVPERV